MAKLTNSKVKSQKSKVEVVKNINSDRDYTVNIEFPEFTCVCPRTGLPDFATIKIEYIPDKLIVELKSLKLYFVSFRNIGTFHEDVVNKILDDLAAACQPRQMKIVGEFSVRGGIKTTVSASYPNP
ncbi:MAG: NADPH-dependent 7-cyano-7-deazaguanine reductase QueF [Candidatus Saganbacteria bacterium]|nr:NADPH-dependent 7-cyano-7-deazaguanine reductase QueF [Candidatus Saganbacteria bacterium]